MSTAAAFVIDDTSELGRSAYSLLRGAGLAGDGSEAPRVLLVDADDVALRNAIRRKPSRVVHVMQALPLPGEALRDLAPQQPASGSALHVRTAPYLEGLLPRLALALRSGRFVSAAADAEAAYVAHEDAAILAAALLASDIREPDLLHMTGPVRFSHRSLCSIASELFSRELRVEEVAFDALAHTLGRSGLSGEQVAVSVRADELLSRRMDREPSGDGARITGIAPLALPAFLTRVRDRLHTAAPQRRVPNEFALRTGKPVCVPIRAA